MWVYGRLLAPLVLLLLSLFNQSNPTIPVQQAPKFKGLFIARTFAISWAMDRTSRDDARDAMSGMAKQERDGNRLKPVFVDDLTELKRT